MHLNYLYTMVYAFTVLINNMKLMMRLQLFNCKIKCNFQ